MSDAVMPTPAVRRSVLPVSHKITDEHLRLRAALYVRQSTSAQLREHQESTARQYALKNRLLAFTMFLSDMYWMSVDCRGLIPTSRRGR